MERGRRRATGLRTSRRISHVFVIDAPNYPRPMFITDAAVNIYPDLARQARHRPECDRPCARAGHHHAAGGDTVGRGNGDAQHPLDLDAAALCKMADRGQITGGILDGPLAFDNAVASEEAAKPRASSSPVAGRAEILVAPDLEAGNMLVKQLDYLADAEVAGIVLGARVPIMLTSRADNTRSRLGSCAIGLALARRAV